MGKRIVSGLILACILVPTFFWAKDMIAPHVRRSAIGRWLSETWQDAGAWIEEQAAIDTDEKILEEEERLNLAIEETSAVLRALGDTWDPKKKAEIQAYRSHLIQERKEILDRKRKRQYRVNVKRLEAEQFKQDRVRERAVREQWASTEKMVQILLAMSKEEKRVEEEQLAALVNALLDDVEDLNVAAVRERCVPEVKPAITRDRLKKAKRALAMSAKEEFKFEATGDGAFNVLFGGSRKLALTRRGQEWQVAHLP